MCFSFNFVFIKSHGHARLLLKGNTATSVTIDSDHVHKNFDHVCAVVPMLQKYVHLEAAVDRNFAKILFCNISLKGRNVNKDF